MAETVYSLANHQFLATSKLDAFYVIATGSGSSSPVIQATYRLDRLHKEGLSFELALDHQNELGIRLTEGNIFGSNLELEMLVVGSVLVETTSRTEENALVRLNAYFNGGMVDTTNRSVTVAGIGISDIMATDPLKVSLVNAPLTTIAYYASGSPEPVNRIVKGVFLEYLPMPHSPLTGQVPGSLVVVHVAMVTLESGGI